jgi:hypothetical protein
MLPPNCAGPDPCFVMMLTTHREAVRGFSRVHKSPRQIQKIARIDIEFGKWGRRHVASGIKGLAAVRQRQRRLVDAPALAAGDLKHEYLVRVIVGTKTDGVAGSYIDACVHRMIELRLDRGGERAERLPSPLKSRQRNGSTGLILGTDAVEVWDAGEKITPRADGPGEGLGRKEPAASGELNGRIPETARRYDRFDVAIGQELSIIAAFRTAQVQRLALPIPLKKRLWLNRNQEIRERGETASHEHLASGLKPSSSLGSARIA